MQIFGIDLWRIIVCAVLIYIVVQRGNFIALFARNKYIKREFEKAAKIFSIASKVGNLTLKTESCMVIIFFVQERLMKR